MAPAKLPTRKIGNTEVSAIGYGAMGIAGVYGAGLAHEKRSEVGFIASPLAWLSVHTLAAVGARHVIRDGVHPLGHRGRVFRQRGHHW